MASDQHLARFYESQTWEAVLCLLCPHQCSIAPSRQGLCGVRGNRNGRLTSLAYGRVTHAAPAPVEDIPFYHFHPGTTWFGVATLGCTMHCPFCNTWRHSQSGGVRQRPATPASLVDEAIAAGARGLYFGINEPAVAHEFVLDVFVAARQRGLLTALSTSGMWSTEPFSEVLELTDALVFGFKGFDSDFLQAECGGLLEQARLNLEMAVQRNRHVEASILILEEGDKIGSHYAAFGEWLADLAPQTPVHVLPMRPDFRWDSHTPTTTPALQAARAELANRLPFVYVAEPPSGTASGRDTRCPSCRAVVVSRPRNRPGTVIGLRGGQCVTCGGAVPVVLAPGATPAPFAPGTFSP